MGKTKLLTGNMAAAWAARQAEVEYIPNFPITPQTECIETLSKWITNGEMDAVFDKMESEHSVMSAAVAASVAGARVFSASSSQGVLLMHEILYIASGLRQPIVYVNVSRSLSAPISLWTDHNDFLDQRDAGWVMIHAENNQEVFDSIIQLYSVLEREDVLLPGMVNMDGYVLSYTLEPTTIEEKEDVLSYAPKRKRKNVVFDGKTFNSVGVTAKYEAYTKSRIQQEKAMQNAKVELRKGFKEFEKTFGRKYDFLEGYMLDDAEVVLVVQGSMTTTARKAVKEARKKGIKAGLLKLRVLRPFPKEEIRKSLENVENIGVFDRNLAPGKGGIMFSEIVESIYPLEKNVVNYIGGLGGYPQTKEKILSVIEHLSKKGKDYNGKVVFTDV